MALSKIKHCTECMTIPGNPQTLSQRSTGKTEPQFVGLSQIMQGITERHFAAIVTQSRSQPSAQRRERNSEASVLSCEGSLGWKCFCILALPPRESIPVIKLHSTINIHAQGRVELGNLERSVECIHVNFLITMLCISQCETVTLGRTEWRV